MRRGIDKKFTAGFAAAVAMLARDHGEDALAWFLLRDAGMVIADYEQAGVDEHDLIVLRRVVSNNSAVADVPAADNAGSGGYPLERPLPASTEQQERQRP